jgi:hypothetical protein
VLGSIMYTLLLVALAAEPGRAPGQRDQANGPSVNIAVQDQSGGVIVGASVALKGSKHEQFLRTTGARGEASLDGVPPGRYVVHIEAPGFEPKDVPDFKVGPSGAHLRVHLDVAHLRETSIVKRDPREEATDPRGTSFTHILTEAQIAQLPDDPDEFEAALKQLAGAAGDSDPIIRIDGFAGGRLPPKSQISEIRFRLDPYAAENHQSGLVGIDIITKPGQSLWHGTFDFGFRDAVFDSREAFAPVRGPEQYRRFGLDLSGPIWRGHTSVFLSALGNLSFESQTIVAATPGGAFQEIVQRPARTLDLSARIEHKLTATHTLRGEFQRNAVARNNLGVGNFDLPDRAYSTNSSEGILRLSDTGLLGHRLVNEFRLQSRWSTIDSESASNSPAIIVLNAFDSGGAQIHSDRHSLEMSLADNVDFALERNSMRAGFLMESGAYRYNELQNGQGTFTFSSLADFAAGRPATFIQRAGSPFVRFSRLELGFYWQDDIRVSKALSLSVGLRDEKPDHVNGNLNLAPRLGLVWSPFAGGRITIRGGFGIFYQWLDTGALEQTLLVNGIRQHDIIVLDPGFPNPFAGGQPLALPPSRIQEDLRIRLPYTEQFTFGIQGQIRGAVLRVNYVHIHGVHLFRGLNINAPLPGAGRPDPEEGNVTQVESVANSFYNALTIGVGQGAPSLSRRLFWFVSYALSRSTNEADSATALPANNFDLRAERGPSLTDARHKVFAWLNLRLTSRIDLGNTFYYSSATPYNILTGIDSNRDGVITARPPGVGRNSARGADRWQLNARLSWTISFGEAVANDQSTASVTKLTNGADLSGNVPASTRWEGKYRLQLYLQASNVLNHVNLTDFSGVQSSPFFGHATAALPGRRIEAGLRFSF